MIGKIAGDYCGYLGRRYPVLCLSDEFYFFPRAEAGADFLDVLDSLDKDKIEQDIAYVRGLKSTLERINPQTLELEAQIDVTLLQQSMATFLREFGRIKIWQRDPTLCLRVLLLGIDQILNKFSFQAGNDVHLRARIRQIPRLLNEARANLKKVPLVYLEISLEMIQAALDYFQTACPLKDKEVLQSLADFKQFLTGKPACRLAFEDKQVLEDILKNSFSYQRSLKEIFEIAAEEYHHTLEEMKQVAGQIKPRQSWQKALSAYRVEAKDAQQLLALYARQIKQIKTFFKQQDVITIPRTQDILVRPTPQFMQPVRASASYSAPVTTDRRECGYFYVTVDTAERPRFSDIHNEYVFVTAHEAYPGHHLLDALRRRMTNPIRRQIESPLFYEGWASYAERLLDHLGYIEHPLQRLVGLKRQAWRAIRAMLDVGIRINKLKAQQAQELLSGLGYRPRTVKSMLRHYLLTPGYQLCYTMGKFEIERLKRRFSSRLGLKKFHDLLLAGGEIPFSLLAKRMEGQLCRKNS